LLYSLALISKYCKHVIVIQYYIFNISI